MGWEVRRGKRCYYRKVRVGGKVRSVYCGPGERGEAASAEVFAQSAPVLEMPGERRKEA